MRKPRARSPGRSYTISCTDGEWEAIKSGAAGAGKRVSPWFVECALNVDPRPERHRRLVLDEKQQRAVVRGVGEIVRGLGVEPGPVSGRAGGKPPQFIADLRELFEKRLRGMAARGKRDEAVSLLRDAVGDERAEAIAAAVIPEAPVTPETQAPAEEREKIETGGEPGPDPRPGTDAEPQGSLL